MARGMPITVPSGMTTSDSASASATTRNASVRTSSKDPYVNRPRYSAVAKPRTIWMAPATTARTMVVIHPWASI